MPSDAPAAEFWHRVARVGELLHNRAYPALSLDQIVALASSESTRDDLLR